MIDGLGGRSPVAALPTNPVAPGPATGGSATTAAVGAVRDVQLDLSALATSVRDMAAAPPVDAAKVARIRSGIASGDYRIDVAAVAERMIDVDLPKS